MCSKQWFANWNWMQYSALCSKCFHGVVSAVSRNVRCGNVSENCPQHAILSQSGQQTVYPVSWQFWSICQFLLTRILMLRYWICVWCNFFSLWLLNVLRFDNVVSACMQFTDILTKSLAVVSSDSSYGEWFCRLHCNSANGCCRSAGWPQDAEARSAAGIQSKWTCIHIKELSPCMCCVSNDGIDLFEYSSSQS